MSRNGSVACRYSKAPRLPPSGGRLSRFSAPRAAARQRFCAALPGSNSRKSARSCRGEDRSHGEKKLALPPEQRNIGLVFQSYALWPHRTVKENVGYGLKLRGVAQAELERRVHAILERMGLGHLGDRFPSQLSGGQQQRVAICRLSSTNRAFCCSTSRCPTSTRSCARRRVTGSASSSSISKSAPSSSPTTRARRWLPPTIFSCCRTGASFSKADRRRSIPTRTASIRPISLAPTISSRQR